MKYKMDKEMYDLDFCAYNTMNIDNLTDTNRELQIDQLFKQASFLYVQDIDSISLVKTFDVIREVLEHFNENEIFCNVQTLPATLFFYADYNDKIKTYPIVVRSVICNVDEIKTMSKFLKREIGLSIYEIYVDKATGKVVFRFSALKEKPLLEKDIEPVKGLCKKFSDL